MDIRMISAIQKMATQMNDLTEKVDRLMELQEMDLEATRTIRTSLVRKYKRAEAKK